MHACPDPDLIHRRASNLPTCWAHHGLVSSSQPRWAAQSHCSQPRMALSAQRLEDSEAYVWLQRMAAAMEKQACSELHSLLNRQSTVLLASICA